MVLQRWDPFGDFGRMHLTMDRRRHLTPVRMDADFRGWAIPVDVVEEEDEILVKASLPGIAPDDIDVTIQERMLTIKGATKTEEKRSDNGYWVKERHTGAFYRMLRLPGSVDPDQAHTQYDNGVLTVAFPKAESKKVRHLKVGAEKEPESTAPESTS